MTLTPDGVVFQGRAADTGIEVGGCGAILEVGDRAVRVLLYVVDLGTVEPRAVGEPLGELTFVGVVIVERHQYLVRWMPLQYEAPVLAPDVGAIVVELVFLRIPARKGIDGIGRIVGLPGVPRISEFFGITLPLAYPRSPDRRPSGRN